MSAALMLRALRDTRWLVLVLAAVLIAFQFLFIFVMGRLSGQLLEFWQRLPLVSQLLRALVGIDPGREVTFASFVAIGLLHPFLLAVLWIYLVVTCSRDTVGEIDRGTADLLLSLPVSRSALYTSVSVVWLGSVVALLAATWVGIWAASRVFHTPEPVRAWEYWRPLVALLCLSVAIGCATMCVSSFTSRRAHALAIIIAGLLFSFLMNFLAAFVPVLEPLCVAGILYYYRPVDIVRQAQLPVRDLVVLLGAAVAAWGVGWWQFVRRDIPAA